MNNIETMLGTENFPGGMASKVWLFFAPSRAYPVATGESPIFAAAKARTHGISQLRAGGRIAACEGGTDQLGWFSQTSYQVPEGAIFKLFAMRKAGGQQRIACIFIRSRAEAALCRFKVALTGYHRATMREAWVEGRFDHLSLAEAKALGVKVLPMYEKMFNPIVANAMISSMELSSQVRAAVVEEVRQVVNSDGQAVTVEQTRRKRMLDV